MVGANSWNVLPEQHRINWSFATSSFKMQNIPLTYFSSISLKKSKHNLIWSFKGWNQRKLKTILQSCNTSVIITIFIADWILEDDMLIFKFVSQKYINNISWHRDMSFAWFWGLFPGQRSTVNNRGINLSPNVARVFSGGERKDYYMYPYKLFP